VAKIRKVATNKSDTVAAMPRVCSDERAAVEFFEHIRWGDTPACCRCGDTDVSRMMSRTGERNKRFLWTCHGCKQQFTVRVGTVMEDSPIPLRHWAYAWWAACSSKKGVSAKQIQRMTGLTYKSALFLMHRVRFAMAPANAAGGPLTGTVEIDETYVGGRPRVPSLQQRVRNAAEGRPTRNKLSEKPPVVVMVERGGRVKARVMEKVSAQALREAICESVDPSARICTDESAVYHGLGKHFQGGHETVTHKLAEYVRGDVTPTRSRASSRSSSAASTAPSTA
jgi:transposase-like protein